ncbi:hypothetical protein LCGC14_0538250 [marine sediment metagenome]|uniref:Uncharacterized protein n=1 Tax=marine sediment metagenome TaxID=412755 RepID=A0A0F9SC37_9ZZZZ|nr:hypothetical protein [bacterium]
MIQISFTRGSALRRIFINGRVISFLTAELNNVPLKIDLDKLDHEREKIDKLGIDEELLREFSQLQTEKEIALDITYDFEKSGWRRIRK